MPIASAAPDSSDTPTLFTALQANLDEVENALLAFQPEALVQACVQLNEALTEHLKQQQQWAGLSRAFGSTPHSALPAHATLSAQEMTLLEQRLSTLRQAVVQQGASNDRALTALMPEKQPSAYGQRSAFGTTGITQHMQTHQA